MTMGLGCLHDGRAARADAPSETMDGPTTWNAPAAALDAPTPVETGAGTPSREFVAIGEARHPALLGRWPLLDDRQPAWLPARCLRTMQRRCDLGDAGAAAWLRAYYRACAGETGAPRAFGRVCENGAWRSPADLQRAFFWYYRAALLGDSEARRDAERLMRSAPIAPAAMAGPALIYPGPWRITAQAPGGISSTSHFQLAEDGSAWGCLIGEAGARSVRPGTAPGAFVGPGTKFLLSPRPQNAQYSGLWTWDPARTTVSFCFPAALAALPHWRGEPWRIELTACRAGAVRGRDRRQVAYTLEHAAPADGHAT
jgi:hypothetical protein